MAHASPNDAVQAAPKSNQKAPKPVAKARARPLALAVWAHPYIEFPENTGRAEVAGQFDRLAKAGIERYLPFVAMRGRPWRDLLRVIVREAHARRIEVHPTVLFFEADFRIPAGRRYRSSTLRDGRYPARTFFDFPCVSWKENRESVKRIIKGIAEEFEVDGIHLDGFRYPNAEAIGPNPCECEACNALRRAWRSQMPFSAKSFEMPGVLYKELEMRNKAVTAMIEAARDIADQRRIKLSMAARARYFQDALIEGQDWLSWVRQGLLDFVCPMSYNDCHARFKQFVDEYTTLLKGVPVEVLVGVGRKSSFGVLRTEEMVKQLELVASTGLAGACIFHLNALSEDDFTQLAGLRKRRQPSSNWNAKNDQGSS